MFFTSPHTEENPVQTTIIIPTYNEADNVGHLIGRLAETCKGRDTSVLIVDDSPTTATIDTVSEAAGYVADTGLAVSSYYRTGNLKWGGLAGAVTDGLRRCYSPIAVVMDGDLQHPPELVPDLIDQVTDTADIAIASRYCPGGTAGGLDGPFRHAVSRSSTYAAKLLFPRALRGITDPMTGFFGIKMDRLDLSCLQPHGFKILLEILARHPDLNVQEIPFDFAVRTAGTSKGDFSQGWQFARHLMTLRASA
jgi:dolichol-phosphate mannosyltransferase